MREPGLRDLMRRVTLTSDETLTAGFPRMRAARVQLMLKDGRLLEHFSPYRQGDPEAPLTDAQVDDKFMELAAPVLGEARSGALLSELWSLDRLEDVRALGLAEGH